MTPTEEKSKKHSEALLLNLLGFKPKTPETISTTRLIEADPTISRIIEISQELRDEIQKMVQNGDWAHPWFGVPGPVEEGFRAFRPSMGWKPLSAADRDRLLQNLPDIPLIIDHPSGPGPRAVWLYGEEVPISKKEFALLSVIALNKGKVDRDRLPDLLADELFDQTYCPSQHTIESLKCELQKRMRRHGDFTIKGISCTFNLVVPCDFLFIDEKR